MFKDIKALSKMAVKTDMAYTAAGKQWLKKARLLKRAMSIEKRLIKAVWIIMPVHAKLADVKDVARQWMAQQQHNINNRVGHTPRLNVSRTGRRLLARLKAKGKYGRKMDYLTYGGYI